MFAADVVTQDSIQALLLTSLHVDPKQLGLLAYRMVPKIALKPAKKLDIESNWSVKEAKNVISWFKVLYV